jgi:hypothetical protein
VMDFEEAVRIVPPLHRHEALVVRSPVRRTPVVRTVLNVSIANELAPNLKDVASRGYIDPGPFARN